MNLCLCLIENCMIQCKKVSKIRFILVSFVNCHQHIISQFQRTNEALGETYFTDCNERVLENIQHFVFNNQNPVNKYWLCLSFENTGCSLKMKWKLKIFLFLELEETPPKKMPNILLHPLLVPTISVLCVCGFHLNGMMHLKQGQFLQTGQQGSLWTSRVLLWHVIM